MIDDTPKPKRRAATAPKPHVVDLVELNEWLATQRLAIGDARDDRDRAYRCGWNGTIDHIRRWLALRSNT